MGMMRILKCENCGKYSMGETCGCGGKNLIVKPPKYSPDDKYAGLRRQVKRSQLEEKGLL